MRILLTLTLLLVAGQATAVVTDADYGKTLPDRLRVLADCGLASIVHNGVELTKPEDRRFGLQQLY